MSQGNRLRKGTYAHQKVTDVEGIVIDPTLNPPRPSVDPGHLEGDFLSSQNADTAEGKITFNAGTGMASGQAYSCNADSSHNKINLWNNANQGAIGYASGQTYGALASGWALSFTANGTLGGFLWRLKDMASSEGLMSLDYTGKLTVASTIDAGGNITAGGSAPQFSFNEDGFSTGIIKQDSEYMYHQSPSGRFYFSDLADGDVYDSGLYVRQSGGWNRVVIEDSFGGIGLKGTVPKINFQEDGSAWGGIYQDGGNLFLETGSTTTYLYAKSGGQNNVYIQQASNWRKVVTEYEGKASNSALLNGYAQTTSATANAIVLRTSSGDIYGRYFYGTHFNTSVGIQNTYCSDSVGWFYRDSSGWLRNASRQELVTRLSNYSGGLVKNTGDTITGTLNIGTQSLQGTSGINMSMVRADSGTAGKIVVGGWEARYTYVQAGTSTYTGNHAIIRSEGYDDVYGWEGVEFLNHNYDNYARFTPTADNVVLLGVDGLRWRYIYAAYGTIITSDERLKDFEDIGDTSWIYNLEPKAYRWKDDAEELRLGFSAQDVYSKMPHKDMGLIKVPEKEEGNWSMNPTELLAPMINEMQKMRQEIKELKEKVNELQMGK